MPDMTNHPKDHHVLAAAVRANADTIVTFNQKDFSEASRAPYAIEVHTPDEFLSELWKGDEYAVARILTQQAAALKSPPHTVLELLHALGRRTPNFVRDVLHSDILESTSAQLFIDDPESFLLP